MAIDFKTKILNLVGKSSKYRTILYEKLLSIFLNEDLQLRSETLTQSSIVFFSFQWLLKHNNRWDGQNPPYRTFNVLLILNSYLISNRVRDFPVFQLPPTSCYCKYGVGWMFTYDSRVIMVLSRNLSSSSEATVSFTNLTNTQY